MKTTPFLAATAAALLVGASPALAERAKLVTYAKTHGSYARPADGEARETFVLSEGQLNPSAGEDADLDAVGFNELAFVLSDALESQGYAPAGDAEQSDLLIVVHRGRTDPQRGRSKAPVMITPGRTSVMKLGATEGNLQEVARMLGYHEALDALLIENRVSSTDFQLQDLITELEQERYYVVLAAYDAQAMRRTGRRVLLWETRLSFQSKDRAFADRYGEMIHAGARFLGEETRGTLDRRFVKLEQVDGPEARLVVLRGEY